MGRLSIEKVAKRYALQELQGTIKTEKAHVRRKVESGVLRWVEEIEVLGKGKTKENLERYNET